MRASTRYPEGFDKQTLGTVEGPRQTLAPHRSPNLWTHLGKDWGEGGDEVWTIRAYACGQREEDARWNRIPGGADYPQGVDKYSLTDVDVIVHRKDTHIGSEGRSLGEDSARMASSHRA